MMSKADQRKKMMMRMKTTMIKRQMERHWESPINPEKDYKSIPEKDYRADSEIYEKKVNIEIQKDTVSTKLNPEAQEPIKSPDPDDIANKNNGKAKKQKIKPL